MCSVLKQLQDESGTVRWDEIKDSVHEISDRLFDDFTKRRKSPGAVKGVLIFDSRSIPLPDGVRSAKVDTRRIKYIIGEYDLELALYPVTSGAYEIIGQLSGIEGHEGCEVILKSAREEFKSRADRFLVFCFPRVPVMKYTLELKTKNRKIASVDINL